MLPRDKYGVVDARLKVSVLFFFFYLSECFFLNFFFTNIQIRFMEQPICASLTSPSFLYTLLRTLKVLFYLLIISQTNHSHYYFGSRRICYWGKRSDLVYKFQLLTDSYSAADLIKSDHGLNA